MVDRKVGYKKCSFILLFVFYKENTLNISWLTNRFSCTQDYGWCSHRKPFPKHGTVFLRDHTSGLFVFSGSRDPSWWNFLYRNYVNVFKTD